MVAVNHGQRNDYCTQIWGRPPIAFFLSPGFQGTFFRSTADNPGAAGVTSGNTKSVLG